MGLTSPDPLWHPQGLTMFDPSPPGPQCDDDILPKAAHTLGNLLSAAAGTCRGLCQVNTPCPIQLPSAPCALASSALRCTLAALSSLAYCMVERLEDRKAAASLTLLIRLAFAWHRPFSPTTRLSMQLLLLCWWSKSPMSGCEQGARWACSPALKRIL